MRDGGLRSSVLILLSAATAIDALASLTGTASKHYGIVFDAGSSGTRIHVYTWQTGGGGAKNDFDLVSDDLLKIKPGLSAFKDTPAKAGASLAPLIEFAKAKVPADQAATTPIFLMATAGLRMVGESAKDAILASVCDYLTTTGYLFRREWATLLGGRDEGLYGWVTVNYLLNALYPGGAEPAGIIDLGGGSVQIVFPTSTPPPAAAPKDYSQTLSFGSRKHPLYVKSHLGFGLDAARTALLDQLIARAQDPLKHPCLPIGATVTHKGKELTGAADHHKCKKAIKRLFGDDDDCPFGKHMCTFGGVYQPPLRSKTFYGFSYMYDRTAAIGLLDGKPVTYGSASMRPTDIEHAAKATCALDLAATTTKFAAANDAAKAPNFCGDAVYLQVLLDKLGFDDDESTLTMTNKIADVELVWTLGAMLAKSAELASGRKASAAGGGGLGAGLKLGGLLAALAGVWYFCCGPGSKPAEPFKLYNKVPATGPQAT